MRPSAPLVLSPRLTAPHLASGKTRRIATRERGSVDRRERGLQEQRQANHAAKGSCGWRVRYALIAGGGIGVDPSVVCDVCSEGEGVARADPMAVRECVGPAELTLNSLSSTRLLHFPRTAVRVYPCARLAGLHRASGTTKLQFGRVVTCAFVSSPHVYVYPGSHLAVTVDRAVPYGGSRT